MSKQEIQRIPDVINFAAEELKVLKLWKDLDAFKTCFVQSKNKPRHLLSDQTDPFNRSPLTMDQVIPNTELADRIKQWIEERKARRSSSKEL